jgi:hypothetical protein
MESFKQLGIKALVDIGKDSIQHLNTNDGNLASDTERKLLHSKQVV